VLIGVVGVILGVVAVGKRKESRDTSPDSQPDERIK